LGVKSPDLEKRKDLIDGSQHVEQEISMPRKMAPAFQKVDLNSVNAVKRGG